MYTYQTPAHILTDAPNAVVYDGELSDAIALSSNLVTSGCALVSDLTDKVATGILSPTAASKTLEDYVTDSSGTLTQKPVHSLIGLGDEDSPAVKTFSYITYVDGQAYLQTDYKEMIHDVYWDDDSFFNITGNTTTATNLSGKTILVGTKTTPLPFFLGEES
jgi:hypothetical protein